MQKHIAIFLLLLMGLSVLPYNAFHHHAEDEHLAAMLGHQEANHHCELDAYFCQDALNNHCEHTAHVSEMHINCFSCNFHFIKHYEMVQFSLPILHSSEPNSYTALLSRLVWAILPLAANKGPPYLA
jgi:hypothetical protein